MTTHTTSLQAHSHAGKQTSGFRLWIVAFFVLVFVNELFTSTNVVNQTIDQKEQLVLKQQQTITDTNKLRSPNDVENDERTLEVASGKMDASQPKQSPKANDVTPATSQKSSEATPATSQKSSKPTANQISRPTVNIPPSAKNSTVSTASIAPPTSKRSGALRPIPSCDNGCVIIFIHVPKTGGSTLKLTMQEITKADSTYLEMK